MANDASANSSGELTDEIRNSALTVAEAINVEPGYWITVKGYIVAAAESSIKNADYRKPFAGKTAFLLADEPSNGTDDQSFDDLMPISLSDAAKGLSASFNLQDNADRWNNFVYIHGIRKQYMSSPGLKEVKNIWIGTPNEQPEPAAEPEDPEEPSNPEEPGSDEGRDSEILTVAQAQKALWDKTICVEAYIVGTTRISMSNTKFDGILEDYTSIILADEKGTTDKQLLFPVGLSKEQRQKLAKYGDDLINKRARVLGIKGDREHLKQQGIPNATDVYVIE